MVHWEKVVMLANVLRSLQSKNLEKMILRNYGFINFDKFSREIKVCQKARKIFHLRT